MACFWTSILNRLEEDKLFNEMNKVDKNKRITILFLITSLKKNNKFTSSVIWQGTELTDKEKEENFEHIKSYDVNEVNNGYLCSIFDPFLLLICELFGISIINIYNGVKIEYINKIKSRYTIILNNNKSHMW